MLKDTITALRHNRLHSKYRCKVYVWDEKAGAHKIKHCVAGGRELEFRQLHIPKLLYDRL